MCVSVSAYLRVCLFAHGDPRETREKKIYAFCLLFIFYLYFLFYFYSDYQ